MKVEKTTQYFRNIPVLNFVQYIISLFIGILFLVGFIPFSYSSIFGLIIFLIVIQIIISIFRLRIFNVLIEFFILFLALFSIIPLLGYIFRLVGFLVSILDMASFKSYSLYKKVEIKKFYSKSDKPKKSSKDNFKFKDAEFKEK